MGSTTPGGAADEAIDSDNGGAEEEEQEQEREQEDARWLGYLVAEG